MQKLLSAFRRDENNKELSINVLYTLLIKGGAMLISILIVPAYVRYFGNDTAYGAWLTVASVFTWINMFDFGIGNGLRNHLVKSIAAKDEEASKRYVSSAYVSVGLISLVFAILGVWIIAVLDWNVLLKVPAEVVSAQTFKLYIEIVFIGVVLHFFFLLISSVCYAIQRTFLPSLFALITQVMILLFIWIPTDAGLETRILRLAGVHLISYNLPVFFVTLFLFFGKLKRIRPNIRWFKKDAAKQIMGLGGAFFLIQLALLALSSSNEIYINTFYTSEDVVQYHYYHKLFYIIMVFSTLVVQPIWSAVSKAFFEKRYLWLQKAWKMMLLVAGAFSLASFLLALVFKPITDIWLGIGTVEINGITLLLFALLNVETAVTNAANCFANGIGRLKSQTICTVSGAVLKLIIMVFLAPLSQSWNLVMLATVIAMLPLAIWQPLSMNHYIKNLVCKTTENSAA